MRNRPVVARIVAHGAHAHDQRARTAVFGAGVGPHHRRVSLDLLDARFGFFCLFLGALGSILVDFGLAKFLVYLVEMLHR